MTHSEPARHGIEADMDVVDKARGPTGEASRSAAVVHVVMPLVQLLVVLERQQERLGPRAGAFRDFEQDTEGLELAALDGREVA